MAIQFHITERSEGDFRLPTRTNLPAGQAGADLVVDLADYEEYSKRLLPLVKKYSSKEKAFVLRTDFNRKVVFPMSGDLLAAGGQMRFNSELADGIVTGDRETALVLLNADCPVIMIEQNGFHLGAFHGGLKCLFPTSPTQSSIIKVALQHFFDPQRIMVTVAGGIGPCCYGMENFLSKLSPADQAKIPTETATRGERDKQRSINLYKLIRNQFRALDLRSDQITIDWACTSHQTTTGLIDAPHKYHSYTRDGIKSGRNAVIIWRE